MIAYDFVELYGIEIKQGHVLLSMEIKAAKCWNVDIMTCFCKTVGKYGEYCQMFTQLSFECSFAGGPLVARHCMLT